MANLTFNRSLGRIVQFAENINGNSPANSVFIIEVVNTTATDAVLKDLDDFAAIEADANTAEVTNSGYARKTISDTSSLTITYDDTNDRVDLDIPDQTWTAVAAGTAWTDVIFGYDSDSTAGADSAVLPCTLHDFSVTPDGSDVSATVNVFFRAS
jgi:hypothetical protein